MGGVASAPEPLASVPPPEWLAVLHSEWVFNGSVYDVMLGDARTEPPTKLCMVAFYRDAARTVRLFPQAGYENARSPFIHQMTHASSPEECEAARSRLEAHEYVRLVHHQEGGALVAFARAHVRDATRAARWEQVAPGFL